MSRIGKKVISVPKGVTITVHERELEVKGPKGTLKTPIPSGISFKLEGEELRAERTSDDQAALHGLARALANNAIVGVTTGFSKQMDVVGVGYKADVQGKKIVFSLGYSHPIEFPLPPEVDAKAERLTTKESSQENTPGNSFDCLEAEMANTNRAEVRNAIHSRIRRKVKGSTERPRLAIYRSLNHIYAQVIDDRLGQTLVSASSTEKDLRGGTGGNLDAARRIGTVIAERALAKGIEQVVFDRGGYLYHGRVKALTDAARAAGLNKNEAVAEANGEPEAAPAEEPKEKKSKKKKE